MKLYLLNLTVIKFPKTETNHKCNSKVTVLFRWHSSYSLSWHWRNYNADMILYCSVELHGFLSFTDAITLRKGSLTCSFFDELISNTKSIPVPLVCHILSPLQSILKRGPSHCTLQYCAPKYGADNKTTCPSQGWPRCHNEHVTFSFFNIW
jgi:hypothetical protein